MLVLLSPAKSLNFDPVEMDLPHSQPEFLKETRQLVKTAKSLKKGELKKLMNLSDKLTELNYERFQAFKTPFTTDNAKQAGLTFSGDVYQGLDAATLSKKDLEWAQNHVGILSGLYGLLRPLDLIQPYRLEMGRPLKTAKSNDLYEFWGDKLTKQVNKAARGDAVINLASNEYFGAIKPDLLQSELITPQFKEIKDGKARVLSFFAKKARGLMTRYIIENRVTKPEDLKKFNVERYKFDDSLSNGNTWVFSRKSQKK